MSRYVIPAFKPYHEVVVGYDQPLSTFFANVEDIRITDEMAHPYVFQLGQRLNAITDLETLAVALAPYAPLPEQVRGWLRADQEVPYQRSALQERMVQFFEGQRRHNGD